MSLSSILFILGTILLLHATYSCLHYRSLVQELEEIASGISTDTFLDGTDEINTGTSTSGSNNNSNTKISIPPIDVYIEVIIGFIIILVSELIRSGSTLQPVSPTITKTTTTTTTAGGGSSSNNKKQKIKQSTAPPYISRDFDIYTTRQRGFY